MHNAVTKTPSRLSRSFALDVTDARLLLELGPDVRVSATELATRLGLSRNTVQAHLLGLERAGLLHSAATLDQVAACGLTLTAFVTIDIAQHDFPDTVAALAEISEVIEAYGITGDGDLWCRIVARDAEDLGRVLGRVGACPGVRRTRTSLAIHDAVNLRVDTILQTVAGS